MRCGFFAQSARNVARKGLVADIARRKEYTKERDDAHEAGARDQAEYDKQLLTLSAGFLAFSLAFIKDIVPLQKAILLWVLYLSLILMAACMLLVLFSYQFSIAGNDKGKKYWESQIAELDGDEGKPASEGYPYSHARWATLINWATGILFALGVVFLICFVAFNLGRQKAMTENKTQVNSQGQEERGSNLKTPPPPQVRPEKNSDQATPVKSR